MLRRSTLIRIAVPAVAALAVGLTIPVLSATADTAAAEECVQAGNVWVHVAYDETVTGACADQFATAQEAVLSAGVTEDKGWIQTVDGRLAEGKEWWSVYTLSPDETGAYGADWDFAQVGVAELELAASDVLALQLQADWELDAVAPATNPVEGVILNSSNPTPTATATETETVTPQPTPSLEPAPSAQPSTRPGPPKTGN